MFLYIRMLACVISIFNICTYFDFGDFVSEFIYSSLIKDVGIGIEEGWGILLDSLLLQ